MNVEAKLYARVIAYIGALLAPLFAILLIYFYIENVKRGLSPSLKGVIIAEFLTIGYFIFTCWIIKRLGWDFWKKNK